MCHPGKSVQPFLCPLSCLERPSPPSGGSSGSWKFLDTISRNKTETGSRSPRNPLEDRWTCLRRQPLSSQGLYHVPHTVGEESPLCDDGTSLMQKPTTWRDSPKVSDRLNLYPSRWGGPVHHTTEPSARTCSAIVVGSYGKRLSLSSRISMPIPGLSGTST